MNDRNDVSESEVLAFSEKLNREAEEGGYHLNPDADFTNELALGLIVNTRRYGYQACPCRLSSGERKRDLDIICPCDYRDPDLEDYGVCYCGLYVSQEVIEGKRKIKRIPDRRPVGDELLKQQPAANAPDTSKLPYPVWRCRVCGYLCARNEPPGICPVCKATKDRFERFM